MTNEKRPASEPLDLEEILAMDWDEDAQSPNPLSDYVELTPRRLAVSYLTDAWEQLLRSKTDSIRLAHSAKSIHLSLQSALTDALSGTANIGAYDEKTQKAFLDYFEQSRDDQSRILRPGRVLALKGLLDRATTKGMEWSREPLALSELELASIERLSHVRDSVEHPKPEFHFVEPRFVLETLPVAARLIRDLLDVEWHHYGPGEKDEISRLVTGISEECQERLD